MSAVAEMTDRTSEAQQISADLVRRARIAQASFANADQARVDEAVRAVAWSLYKPEHARELAELAVKDTGLGNVPDKIIKKQRKTFGTLRDLLRAKTVGEIERDDKLFRIHTCEAQRGRVRQAIHVTAVYRNICDPFEQG